MKTVSFVILGTLLVVNNTAASWPSAPDDFSVTRSATSLQLRTAAPGLPAKQKPALVRRFGLRGPRRHSQSKGRPTLTPA